MKTKYTSPYIIPLEIRIEKGFIISTEGFEQGDEVDPGWE